MIYHLSAGKTLKIMKNREEITGNVIIIEELHYKIKTEGFDDADTIVKADTLAVFEKTMMKYKDTLERLAQ